MDKKLIGTLEECQTRTTANGLLISTLYVKEKRFGRDNLVHAIAFDALAREFEALVKNFYEENAVPGVKVELSGYWKKRGWTDAKGERKETWEFNVKSFVLGGIASTAVNPPPAKKTAAAAPAPSGPELSADDLGF